MTGTHPKQEESQRLLGLSCSERGMASYVGCPLSYWSLAQPLSGRWAMIGYQLHANRSC